MKVRSVEASRTAFQADLTTNFAIAFQVQTPVVGVMAQGQ